MSCQCHETIVLKQVNGVPLVWCDPCIAPIVRALNDAGIKTIASCCGHLVRPSSIILTDEREILIMPFKEARKIAGWWPPIYVEVE